MCRVVTVSLSSPDLFICWFSVSLSPLSTLLPLFLYCLSPWQSVWWFHPLPADCLLSPSSFSHCCLSRPFPRHRPPRMIFLLFLWLSRISTTPPRPPRTPVSQQSCQIKITSFKNSVNITPYKQRGPLLVGYSCIQVYIVSWWRCIRHAGRGGGSPTRQFHQNLMYSFIVTSKLCLFADNRDVYQGPGRTGTCRSVSYRASRGPAPAGLVTPARSPAGTRAWRRVPAIFPMPPSRFLFPFRLSRQVLVVFFRCSVSRQTPYVLSVRISPPSVPSISSSLPYLHPCLVSHSWGQTKVLLPRAGSQACVSLCLLITSTAYHSPGTLPALFIFFICYDKIPSSAVQAAWSEVRCK